MMDYDFTKQLEKSDTDSIQEHVSRYLQQAFPDVSAVNRASTVEDRSGVDYWVVVSQNKSIGVDVKVRDLDPIETGYGDDIALEIWSSIGYSVGWSLDSKKQTDYVLWFWTTTNRFFLVPFLMLCQVFRDNYDTWTGKYKRAVQNSGSWRSECVFVPRSEIVSALYDKYWDSVANESI
jgi:hypothetical protein